MMKASAKSTVEARKRLYAKFGGGCLLLSNRCMIGGEPADPAAVADLGIQGCCIEEAPRQSEAESFLVNPRALFEELRADPSLVERVGVRTAEVDISPWLSERKKLSHHEKAKRALDDLRAKETPVNISDVQGWKSACEMLNEFLAIRNVTPLREIQLADCRRRAWSVNTFAMDALDVLLKEAGVKRNRTIGTLDFEKRPQGDVVRKSTLGENIEDDLVGNPGTGFITPGRFSWRLGNVNAGEAPEALNHLVGEVARQMIDRASSGSGRVKYSLVQDDNARLRINAVKRNEAAEAQFSVDAFIYNCKGD